MSRDLAELGRFTSGIEAHSIRILLEASGIPAWVAGDLPLEHGLVEATVMVRRTDLALAIQIVEEVPPASEVLIPEWSCQCGETVDAGFHRCWSCGAEHE
jgi:hypothetical protein